MQSGDRAEAFRAGFAANVSEAARAEEGAYDRWLALVEAKPVAVQVILRQVQAIGQHDTSQRLGDVRVPTLVVHGTEDQMLPVSNAEMIGRLIPHARVEILDGVGHMFWWEQPERSAEIIRDHALSAAAS
jgi:pimeloyl-ACP methyl ester carboxylesterase